MLSRRCSSACSGTSDCWKITDLAGSRPAARKSMVICRVFSAMARRIGVVAGEGVPVGDEVEAIVGGIVLQADPVLQRAEIVADVEASGGAHAGENAIRGGGQENGPR